MLKRPLFWLSLLLGSFAAFGSLLRKPRKPATLLHLPLDFISDAVVLCNAAGAVVHINAAAQTLFGTDGAGLTRLCYPSGQAIPPGQQSLRRVLRAGKAVIEIGCRYASAAGAVHILDVSARLLPDGGAAAVFCDMTAQHECRARESAAQARHWAVQALCRRLNKAPSAQAAGQAVVETIHALLGTASDAQVRLYGYDPAAQTVTRLASEPEDRPKRPKSAQEAQPPLFRFDARIPALWQIYVAREPSTGALPGLGEDAAVSRYALPLVSGDMAVGHLSLACASAGVLEDPALRETLGIVASLAASALAGTQAAQSAAAWTAQAEALHEIAEAAAGDMERGRWADMGTGHVRRVLRAEVCTLSVPWEGKLSVIGEAFRDDLLFPARFAPNDTALHGKTIQKVWRTQKTVIQCGIANPGFEKGLWRAFAGKTGQHSVAAVPLTARHGVLTVYTAGDSPLPEAQIKFLETAAALASLALFPGSFPGGLPPASVSEDLPSV